MQYELSNEVEKVADEVIKQFHPDLRSKDIRYMILDPKDSDGTSKPKVTKDHQIPAEIKILPEDAAFLVSGESRTDDNGPHSIVIVKVNRYLWDRANKDNIRKALLDSQLCRLIYDDETGRASILEYDAKLSNSNLARFGAWNNELKRVAQITEGLPLLKGLEESVTNQVKVVKPTAGNGKVAEEAPKSDLPSLKQEVAKKRGRGASAGAK